MTELLSPTEPVISTPLVAAMQDRDEDDQFLLSSTFLSLGDDAQEILVGEKTLQQLRGWATGGLIPETHLLAIAKLIGLAALDTDVSVTSLALLMERLGITQENAARVAQEIAALIQPILTERAKLELPETMSQTELPPLTRPSENGPKPFASASTVGVPTSASRNIIDLRQKQ